jgi:cell division protease FtsH
MLFKNNNAYKIIMWVRNLYSFLLFTTISYYQVETYKLHTTTRVLPPREKNVEKPIMTTQNKYPLSKKYYLDYLERLNQHNKTTNWIKTPYYSKRAVTTNYGRKYDEDEEDEEDDDIKVVDENGNRLEPTTHEKQILELLNSFGGWIQIPPIEIPPSFEPRSDEELENNTPSLSSQFMKDVSKRKQKMISNKKIKDGFIRSQSQGQGGYKTSQNSKPVLSSENFVVNTDPKLSFKDIGGYEDIKKEMLQTFDILTNYSKYKGYNVRIPKGLILEGPPGNGKTMLAKGISGETNIPCIVVSGSEFQEKYIGVGPSKVRELFDLAKKNKPCIIFIDEIDAIGRTRSGEGEASSSERDSTLNELLIGMDGYNTESEIFVLGATNRVDLLDAALVRPGRIDKKIFVGNPDKITRKKVIDIHISGKPYDETVKIDEVVDTTEGLSCAEIENLLNEAMLYALRDNREAISKMDLDIIYNKILTGWQSNEQEFTNTTVQQICIHEIGHVIMSLHTKEHPKFRKVSLNLHSPSTPGFTLFEKSSELKTMTELREHVMILLAGRIAEEMFYGNASVSTGAVNDFNEALKTATTMVSSYGVDKNFVYSTQSEKYSEKLDDEVNNIIKNAYDTARNVMKSSYDIIQYISFILHNEAMLTYNDVIDHIHHIDPNYFNLH